MTRYERRIYQFGIVCAAVMLIAITAVLADECSAKKALSEPLPVKAEETTEETTEAPETGEIRKQEPTQEDATDEQEASKEAPAETTCESRMDGDAADQADAADPEGARSDSGPETVESEAPGPVYYRIAGGLIPEEIQTALHEALDAEGIGFWYEGALAQVFQESHGNPAAENPNGLDKGLLQYRTTYWPQTAAAYGEPGADIFDWRAQVRVYARQTAARINAGLTTDEIISRHKTSDSCPALDTVYIQQVRQWLGQMEEQR